MIRNLVEVPPWIETCQCVNMMKKYKNCYKIERATLTNVGSSKDVHVEFLKE